ncbi:MAG TPA: hypothetical protein VKV26_14995 [Dehalococcoidia bacterium]|nr:hypothetical protein [Dehalococcoidia bacterium]
MPTLEEAANAFARDLTAVPPNIAGLMLVFTPEGMMKAMAMQGQMQQRAAAAMAAGQMPAPTTGFTVDLVGQDGDDHLVNLKLQSADGTAEIATRWRELEGVWKVNDLGLTGVLDAQGKPVDLSAPPAAGAPPASPPPSA